MAPMNIAHQNTIDELGRIVGKDCLTHDQSFVYKGGSGKSVNNRVRKDELIPCMFGSALRRLFNWIVTARIRYANCKIVMTKIDFKSAYRWEHLNTDMAVQSVTHLPDDGLALVALRLTFGGAACLFEWYTISETICDLTNAILHNDDWNPNNLFAPNSYLMPEPKLLPDEIPLAKGRDLVVDVPVNPKGTNEIFINNNMTLAVDIPGSDNALQAARAT